MAWKTTLSIDGTTYEVEVDGDTVLVDGQPFSVSVKGREVTVNGTNYTVELAGDQVLVNGIPHAFRRGEVAKAAASPAATAAKARPTVAEDANAVKAIMPGKVLRVLVNPGDTVAEGDVVLILEAMKMENELRVHKAGKVKAVHARPGQDVEMAQVLVEIE